MKIVINSINYSGSIVDGPGIRTVVYLQGCEQRCLGCHNPNTWDIGKGISMDTHDLVKTLQVNVINKKLTISGGEPLQQYSAILEVLKGLPDFNIVLYTGFEFEDVPKEILKHVHYIKAGKYIHEKRCTDISYIGSTNQKFINLKEV